MPMLWHAYIIVGEAANIDRAAGWVEGWVGGGGAQWPRVWPWLALESIGSIKCILKNIQ